MKNDLYIQNIGINGKSKEVNGIIFNVWTRNKFLEKKKRIKFKDLSPDKYFNN